MSSPDSSSLRTTNGVIDTNDHISKMPPDILLKIISGLSTVDVVKTSVLSKRWKDVWKGTSHLTLNMIRIARTLSDLVTTREAAKSVTKVIKDHRGNLERFRLFHYPIQYEKETFATWIQSLVHEKLTKHLILANCSRPSERTKPNFTLTLPPNTFSHPNLVSLLLCQYDFETPHAFNNCGNLKTLQLMGVAVEIGVLNVILVSCSSLEALVLHISIKKGNGILKIENRGLKFLHISCADKIDGVEVSTPSVHIFSIGSLMCDVWEVSIANAEIKFNRNYWAIGRFAPHISYNITCTNQEEKSIAHEFMLTRPQWRSFEAARPSDYMQKYGAMSVNVDLTNTREVEMLKDVLVACLERWQNLRSCLSTPQKEGECWKKFWEGTKPFPNASFRAYWVWLYNFSGSKEEFALASRLITQVSVLRTLTIQLAPSDRNAAMASARELPEAHNELSRNLV